MKQTLLTLGITLVVVGCAHGPTNTADRALVMSPELVAHENIHRLGAASHTAVVDSGQASAELRVCVTPDGNADKVILTRSSGSDWFDRAAEKELKESRYRRFRAPAHIRVCSPMKVVVADRRL